MSTFLVYVRDEKVNKPETRMEPYYWGDDPPEPVWCADVVQAETPAQAKHRFLEEWAGGGHLRSPVYHDDWPSLRVRILSHDDIDPEGPVAWMRIHEILEHAGGSCDCPDPEEE